MNPIWSILAIGALAIQIFAGLLYMFRPAEPPRTYEEEKETGYYAHLGD